MGRCFNSDCDRVVDYHIAGCQKATEVGKLSKPIACDEYWQVILLPEVHEYREQASPAHLQSVLMRVEVSRAKTGIVRLLDLCAKFDFNLSCIDRSIGCQIETEITLLIDERGNLRS